MSKTQVKKFYWLKLNENFFDDDTIRFIEEQENGIKYSNFYLKLCLKSIKTNGKLIRLIGEQLIPYDVVSLSKLTGVDADVVRSSMILFEKIGIIRILESGEIYLSQINEMIGSETDKALLMRRKRAKDNLLGNNVTSMLPDCYPDIEKEIEKEINTDIEKNVDEDAEIKKELNEILKICENNNIELSSIAKDYIYNNLKNKTLTRELISYGIADAIDHQIKNWCYIQKILERYKFEDFKTIDEVKQDSIERNKVNQPTYNKKFMNQFYAN